MYDELTDWDDIRPKQVKILKRPYKREFEVGCYYRLPRALDIPNAYTYFKILGYDELVNEYRVIEWNQFLERPWERNTAPINLRGAKKVKPTLDIIFKIGG